ncbi:MAG: hypothetical protein M3Y84_07295 [Acidobacteriota bacterium]|nr:hypothetical protein [Acidobacteriota bacterium]
MITDSHEHELFSEPKGSLGAKLVAGVCALTITALVLAGYAFLRRRHLQNAPVGSQALSGEPKGPPKAMVLVDDALMQGGKTIIGGTVKNISAEKLEELSVELELKRRKDGIGEKQLVALEPSQLDPAKEARYSIQLKGQDYGSVRLVALKAGPNLLPLAYTVAQGQKRPAERLESKTIIIDKRSSQRGEFLNSPDNPARVP